jgi:hypothetical protein
MDGLRGYATGLIFVPAVVLYRSTSLSIEWAVLVEMSAIIVTLGWFVLPSLASAVLNRPARIADRVLLLALALFAFWKSDRMVLLMLVGGLGGLAYNVRPAYILVTAGLVVLAVLGRSGATRLRLSRGALVLAGVLVGLAPQGIVNAMEGTSPIPPIPPQTGALVTLQIEAGLGYQRYETSLDPTFPSPQLAACDPGGRLLLVRSGAPVPRTIIEYAALLATDPIEGAALITRRVENGVWLDERSPYVLSRASRTDALGFVNVVLLGLFAAFTLLKGRAHPRVAMTAIMVLLACAPAISTVVEQRFFLPVSAGAIAFCLPIFGWLRHERRVVVVGVVMGSLVLAVLVSSATTQTAAFEAPGFMSDSLRLDCATILRASNVGP